MKNKLARYVGTGKKIRITRRYPGEPYLHGYLLGLSDELVLMHLFNDFFPDGYSVFPVADVVAVRCGPYERWSDFMLRSEGLLSGIFLPYDIDLTNMKTAIRSIADHYPQMIIECEDPDEETDSFFIGKLFKIDKKIIRFHTYDALGFWDKKPTPIRLDEITRVQFDAPYIRTFSKYTRSKTEKR